MKYIISLFIITLTPHSFSQTDSTKLIDELNIDLSIKNDLSWENYNKKVNIKPLFFSGKGTFNGKYYKNGQEIIFTGEIIHNKNKLVIDFTNSIQDKDIRYTIEEVLNQAIRISNYYYFNSNKKGVKPYQEFATEKVNNTWIFNTYKKDIKKEKLIEDKRVRKEVTLDNNGRIKKIITSLKSNENIPIQSHFQDHYIEIYLVPYGTKQKYSQINGEIISIISKNKIDFEITFNN